MNLASTTLEYTLLCKALWQELENGYRQLIEQSEGDPSPQETAKKLAERAKPYQEAVIRYIDSQDSLRWMNKRRGNYLQRLLGPRIGSVYLSLLPPQDRAKGGASRNQVP